MFSRFLAREGPATPDESEPLPRAAHPAPNEAPPTQTANAAGREHEKPPGHRRKFSETDFMDSGMGRSHTSDMPFLGLDDELDDEQFDDLFTEQLLLSKLNDAQRRLREIRDYKDAVLRSVAAEAAAKSSGDADTDEQATDTERTSPSSTSPRTSPRSATTSSSARQRRRARLFVASFRLPLKIQVDDEGGVKSSLTTGGLGLVSAFRELLGRIPIRWLGAPGQLVLDRGQGTAGGDMDAPAAIQPTAEERTSIEAHLTAAHPDSSRHHSMGLLTYVPIFAEPEDAADHQEFCNSVLWQLFHYLPLSFEGERVYQPYMFEAYERVNQTYANALVSEWEASGIEEQDAMFWVHDIHLLLVPKMLREKLPNARIGFFLHTPFPAGEVYRTLPARKELLAGMLGADLIGFHTYDYARHFLGACERLLGLAIRPDRVDNGGVYVHVGIYPFGIDTESFKRAMNKSSVQRMRDDLRDSLAGKKIIVGVERLDFIKGIPNKLLAIENFLDMHPEWRGRVVFLQVATPSRTSSEEYHTFRSEVLELVGRINGRFATLEDMPIHYRERTLTFEELCALYAVADVAVLTSLRDGMNLVSYEYVMCQKEHHGALVLSEFTGAAQNLPGAILCNPWNIDEVANSMHKALEMTDSERESKHHKMYGYIMLNTAAAWGVHFIDDLVKYAAYRRAAIANLVLLPDDNVCKLYKVAERRLLFLDYDGTLRKYESQPELAEPNDELKCLLKRLAADPKNIIFIVTGRQKATMELWFGESRLGFSVEHGYAIRWPDHLRDTYGGRANAGPEPARTTQSSPSASPSAGNSGASSWTHGVSSSEHGADSAMCSSTPAASPPDSPPSSSTSVACEVEDYDGWDAMLDPADMGVMRTALQRAAALLRRIEAYTPASFISVKESALTWHFRDADPDFAFSAAQDARQALDEVLFGSPMEVLVGSEAIHVRPRGIHKGAAVAEIMRRLFLKGWKPDFIISIGDDRTDEEMFGQVHASTEDIYPGRPVNEVATTVTVGRKTTLAHFFAPNVKHVLNLLRRFSEHHDDALKSA